jgi:hypothetical protein
LKSLAAVFPPLNWNASICRNYFQICGSDILVGFWCMLLNRLFFPQIFVHKKWFELRANPYNLLKLTI